MNKILILSAVVVSNLLGSSALERFPTPAEKEVQANLEKIAELGKGEVFSLPYDQLAGFLWDRYVRGPSLNFHHHGANPSALAAEQAMLPATILIHSSYSNQGQWLPLLSAFEESAAPMGPIFTFNYEDGEELSKLRAKIEEIKALYKQAGKGDVVINLVGHSLGGICAAEYAFSPELWVEGTRVGKVITIAARLKNIDNPLETPYYPYCVDTLRHIEAVWEKIEQNRGLVELYTIAAEKDWLVPKESVLVATEDDHKAVVPNEGHVLISRSQVVKNLVVKWLNSY